MTLRVEPSGGACGARIIGLDLSQPLDGATIAAVRAAWLKHHVVAFPDQHMSDDDLERFTLAFGGFGDDPFFAPIAGRQHIAAIRREADEQSPLFAENWHSDWSFQARPPAGPACSPSTFRRPAATPCSLISTPHGKRSAGRIKRATPI